MANRRFEQFQLSLEKKVVKLYAQISFGASGAPTLVRAKGIASIARVSAGKYNITFGMPANSTTPLQKDLYNAFLSSHHVFLNATAPAAPAMYITSNGVTSGTLQVVFNAAGTSTDPASGEKVFLELSLSNSSI